MNSLPQMFQDIQSVNASDDAFELGPYDVLCGRHKDSFNHIGNRRFRIIISNNLQKYINSPTRFHRSDLILSLVRELCYEVGVRFLKKRGSTFVELSEKECREKVGHALRDAAAQYHQQQQWQPMQTQQNSATTNSHVQKTKIIRIVSESSEQEEVRPVTPHFQFNAQRSRPVEDHKDATIIDQHNLHHSHNEQDRDDSDDFSLSDESFEATMSILKERFQDERTSFSSCDLEPIPLEWI